LFGKFQNAAFACFAAANIWPRQFARILNYGNVSITKTVNTSNLRVHVHGGVVVQYIGLSFLTQNFRLILSVTVQPGPFKKEKKRKEKFGVRAKK